MNIMNKFAKLAEKYANRPPLNIEVGRIYKNTDLIFFKIVGKSKNNIIDMVISQKDNIIEFQAMDNQGCVGGCEVNKQNIDQIYNAFEEILKGGEK